MERDTRGYTLVELLVAMSVFMILLMVATSSFNTILTQAAKLVRAEESNIEGAVGLEIMRRDLMQAGFGLPYEYEGTPPQYPEAASPPASTMNNPLNTPPLPVSAANDIAAVTDSGNTTIAGSDYLTIRAVSVSTNDVSRRWTYVQYSSSGKLPKKWPSNSDNITDGTWVILLRRSFSGDQFINRLVQNTAQPVTSYENYATQFASNSALSSPFRPQNPEEFLYVYAIGEKPPRMPFNRADYFVATGNVPSSCSENTGVLYKAVVNHSVGGGKDGSLEYIPVLDCVADLQIVFGWDLTGDDGLVDTYSNADGTAVSGSATIAQVQAALGSPDMLRSRLKLIKVYLLAQVGRLDRSYTYPDGTIVVGDTMESALTRQYNLTEAMRHYRWKVYRLVVRPPNLMAEQ